MFWPKFLGFWLVMSGCLYLSPFVYSHEPVTFNIVLLVISAVLGAVFALRASYGPLQRGIMKS